MEDDASSDGESELEEEEDNTSDGIVLFIAFIIYIIVGSVAIAAYEPNMDLFEVIRIFLFQNPFNRAIFRFTCDFEMV